MNELRVAVNLTWMSHGRVGGSEQYLTRQLAGLPHHDHDLQHHDHRDHDLDVRLYIDAEFAGAHPDLAHRFATSSLPGVASGRAARIVAEHTWLATQTRGADVVHHGGGTAPLVGKRPFVLTIHDLQYLMHPHYFSPTRRRYLAAMVPRSVRRAAVIAVPSQVVRDHVADAFGIAADRIVVVPHGVPDMRVPDAATVATVRSRHAIGDRPYVVYPAVTHPHKRHAVLIDMLGHLDRDDDTAVVLIGGEGHAESEVRAAIDASEYRARIVRPGRVSEADRDALVAGADVLAFPSEFEGFGAPLIEAMALDTPVICSDADAVTEVVGDAAVIVTAPTGEAWAAALTVARTRRTELIAAGRRRRAEFTIERSGRAIADAYRRAGE